MSQADPSAPSRALFPLWIIWAGLLFGGMVMAGYEKFDSGGFLTATRLSSSLVLVIAGFAFYLSGRGPGVSYPLFCIAMGMLFGFLGDVSNSQLLIKDKQLATVGGIVTFAIGHLFYMAACLRIRRDLQLNNSTVWWGSILVWQVIGIVGWVAVIYTITPRQPTHWAALPYTLLLAGTAGMTTGLALQDQTFTKLGLGGALFLASDFVLAFLLFRQDVDFTTLLSDAMTGNFTQLTGSTPEVAHHFFHQVDRHSCWLLYGPAQMFIVYSGASIIAAYKRRNNR